MSMDQTFANDLTDSIGASRQLSERFGRNFGIDSVHQLVKQDKLRSFLFQNGQLSERKPGENTRGKDLIFLRSDVEAIEAPRRPGRPPKTKE